MKTGRDTKKFTYTDIVGVVVQPSSTIIFADPTDAASTQSTVTTFARTYGELSFKRSAVLNQKYNPHSDAYIVGEGSGSFTAQIDPFRQGVSVINDQLRAKTTLPTADSAVLELNFGDSPGYLENGPFHDKPNYEAIGATEGL